MASSKPALRPPWVRVTSQRSEREVLPVPRNNLGLTGMDERKRGLRKLLPGRHPAVAKGAEEREATGLSVEAPPPRSRLRTQEGDGRACGTCSQKDLLASAESYSEGIGGEGRPHPPRPHVRCPKTASGKQLPHSHRPSENKQGSSGDASTFRAPHPSQVRGPDETRQTPPTPPPRPRGKPAARLPAGAGAALAASGSEPSGSAWWPRQQPVSGRGEAPDAWK
ncbi:uncharacterized protein LOC109497680 isoform X2 [Felis catus]|uniref:uncharacterized protein LOC109497680 isoform X2 n=1 Tax=Felis catus TaxID=9685 RepID=UPI00094854BC|nr:uncharacterized protein LOC109497680 isoform X2 [Felis catus]